MKRRLLVSYLALTGGVLLVLLVPLALTYRARLLDDQRASLQNQAFLVAAFAEDHLEGERTTDVAGLRRSVARVRLPAEDRLLVTDRHGQILVDAGGGPPLENLASLVGPARAGRPQPRLTGERTVVAVPISSNGKTYGAVVLSSSLDTVEHRTHRYWLVLAGIAAGALALAGATGVVLARSVTRPLEVLRQSAYALGEGDLRVRARADVGSPEVRDLAEDFNRMATRLAELVRSEAEFAGDASHELRTPLTALRLQLENLASEPAGIGDGDLASPLAEVERLSRLVEGLLALARSEQSSGTPSDVDIVDLVKDRADAWHPLAQELGISLLIEPVGTGPITAAADGARLIQVLDNLLANALDATAATGTIVMRTSTEPEGPTIHVIDDGPGLSEQDRRRAFDRFWRANRPEADAGLGGTGLGLAITARLVAADGGTIRLDSSAAGGIDAVVTLRDSR